eukprot:TRINITY_DN14948_c0_g1_i2.p1 TRINITY_DN14948_c0_g1~~TRINITY_DN14948_c0_g1_i2.p1  ORF type:complete len:164 (+),score=39.50 TRINITY_DN14948_c0_g1_i2:106-597(+)
MATTTTTTVSERTVVPGSTTTVTSAPTSTTTGTHSGGGAGGIVDGIKNAVSGLTGGHNNDRYNDDHDWVSNDRRYNRGHYPVGSRYGEGYNTYEYGRGGDYAGYESDRYRGSVVTDYDREVYGHGHHRHHHHDADRHYNVRNNMGSGFRVGGGDYIVERGRWF